MPDPHAREIGKKLLASGEYVRITAFKHLNIFRYNGRMTDTPPIFPSPMEEACKIIERVVNEEISKRTRFPLEWAGKEGSDLIWEANVAAANCYEGSKESVGFHSDQMTYLGPYCTIGNEYFSSFVCVSRTVASLSLGKWTWC